MMLDIKGQLQNQAKAVNTVIFLFSMVILDLIAEEMNADIKYEERKERGLLTKRNTYKEWLSSFPNFLMIIKANLDESQFQHFKHTVQLLYKMKKQQSGFTKKVCIYFHCMNSLIIVNNVFHRLLLQSTRKQILVRRMITMVMIVMMITMVMIVVLLMTMIKNLTRMLKKSLLIMKKTVTTPNTRSMMRMIQRMKKLWVSKTIICLVARKKKRPS